MPPDSSRGQVRSKPFSPTLASAAAARAARSLRATPRSLSGNATLASAVAQGISVGSWKTKPSSALPADESIVPPLGGMSPAIRRSKVDLPQPDGPRTLRNSPASTSSETLASAWTPFAKTLETPRTPTSGIRPGAR